MKPEAARGEATAETKKTNRRRNRRRERKKQGIDNEENKGNCGYHLIHSEEQIHTSKEIANMGGNDQLADTKASVPNLPVGTTNSESLSSEDTVKHWFSTLSVGERVAAFSFDDRPMFLTFLELTSLSRASHGNPSRSGERTTDEQKGQFCFHVDLRNISTKNRKNRGHDFDLSLSFPSRCDPSFLTSYFSLQQALSQLIGWPVYLGRIFRKLGAMWLAMETKFNRMPLEYGKTLMD